MEEWTDEHISKSRRLHFITLCFAMVIALGTYPLQVFTSYRLLTNRFSSPIYKLIILNGFLGIFQIAVHLLTRHLSALYECAPIYEFLQKNRLEWLAGYLMAFSYIVRIHCTFLIAVNRFLRCRPGSEKWIRNDRFPLSLLSNLILPLIFAAPLPIFGDFSYVAIPAGDDHVAYQPDLPLSNINRLRNLLSVVPPLLYFTLLAVSSFFLNIFVLHKLMAMRNLAGTPTVKTSMFKASERGLAITSVCTMLAQVGMLMFFLILQVKKTAEASALNIIPLTLNSAIPFWVLLVTVPTVRHALPSFGRTRTIILLLMDSYTDEKIEQNRRLHLIALVIALVMAAATYPLQLFISYRLLTSRITAPIYKLIILNGSLGIFQILVHIFIRQLPAFYECSFIYSFLVENKLEWIAGYLMAFSYVVRIHCTFLIASNRFIQCTSGSDRWLRNNIAFRLSLLSNLLLPLIFALPLPIFGEFHYTPISMSDGRRVYIPGMPLSNMKRLNNLLSVTPPLLYFCILAVSSFALNIYIVYKLISMRKQVHASTVKSSTSNASERGLAITSVSTMFGQSFMLVSFILIQVRKTPEVGAFNIIPLMLNSVIPCWVLLATVPTVRHALPFCGSNRSSALFTPTSIVIVRSQLNSSHSKE